MKNKNQNTYNRLQITGTIKKQFIIEMYTNLEKSLVKQIQNDYVFTTEFKQYLIKELGADAYVLYEYFYDTSKKNARLIPTDDEAIGKQFGWSASKVARLKSKLKQANMLLIIKETTTQGTTLYKVLLNPSLIQRYNETGELPDEIEVIGKEDRGDSI